MVEASDEALLLWYLDGYWNYKYNPACVKEDKKRFDWMLQPSVPSQKVHRDRDSGVQKSAFVGHH